MQTATDGNGHTTSYGYTNGNLTSITPPPPLGQLSLSYDSLNRIHTLTDGKGQSRTYSYDALDRVTEIAFGGGPTLDYSYDADGNLKSESQSGGSDYSYSYGYDQANRLVSETQPSQGLGYGYDPAGNLTSLTDESGSTGYRYNAENQVSEIDQPGSFGAIRFSYDPNGNRSEIDYPNLVFECLAYDDWKLEITRFR